MTEYDFRALNDKEFESLCADLLGETLNARFERFKPGRDSGVDGRYFHTTGREVVLQCKHWVATPIEQLIRQLQKEERPKVALLQPERYLVAISNALSRADKTAIQEALAPYIKSPSDIYGKEDLNDLIAKSPEIEKRHYKLWLASASVLSHMLNRPIFDRSGFTIEETLETIKKYVMTSNHTAALEMLEAVRVVILTGEPGVGKTTLAEHLCLHYVTHDFELLRIADEIREAESVFDPDKKQVFYFDDFLGRNYLEALSGHEGNQIVQFIRRVSKDSLKRFILTSRSTILNQGKILIDTFQHHHMDKREFELRVSSLSELDKARILYSHIWHSSLGPQYVEELYKLRRYRSVIQHQNFNPRLISFMTDSERLTDCPHEKYWDYVQRMLANPADVWEHPFVAQQDDFGRCMVMLVTLNGRPIEQEELAEAYARYATRPQNHAMGGRRDFLLNLRHLTGSLLSRRLWVVEASSAITRIDLFNPSIGDFVLRRSVGDVPTIRAGFLSLRSTSSLDTLLALKRDEMLSAGAYREIVASLLQEAIECAFTGFEAQYVASLIRQLTTLGEMTSAEHSRALKGLDFLLQEPVPSFFEDTAEVLAWARRNLELTDNQVVQFLREVSESQIVPSYNEVQALVGLRDLIDPDHKQYSVAEDDVKECAKSYLAENIYEAVEDADVFGDVDYHDLDSAGDNVQRLLQRWLDKMRIRYSGYDLREISESFDLRERRAGYYGEEQSSGYRPRGGTGAVTSLDEIDDLFDRA